MRKKSTPWFLIIALILIVSASVVLDLSGILKSQILRAPEVISPIKLIHQETDPVQFDIFYEDLKNDNPADLQIVIVSSLIYDDGRYQNKAYIVDKLILLTGEEEVLNGLDTQNITIRNLSRQNTTRLGTIVTNIPKSKYIALEY